MATKEIVLKVKFKWWGWLLLPVWIVQFKVFKAKKAWLADECCVLERVHGDN